MQPFCTKIDADTAVATATSQEFNLKNLPNKVRLWKTGIVPARDIIFNEK